MLTLEWLNERMVAARNYWLSSTTPDGRPHVRPVDGVWVDGALCFGGGPTTRWVRNLRANPALTVSLGGEEAALILEGNAEWIEDPADPLVEPSQLASRAKYPGYHGDGSAPFQPFFAFRPRVAYAWTLAAFPASATRWEWS
jgi:hypothetical protein